MEPCHEAQKEGGGKPKIRIIFNSLEPILFRSDGFRIPIATSIMWTYNIFFDNFLHLYTVQIDFHN